MRLFKLLIVTVGLGGIGWIATQSVRVESSENQVHITIDRQKLREAGATLKQRGRNAMNSVGHALEEAGEPPEEERPRPTSPFQGIFKR